MFRYKSGIPVSYSRQGYIYFTSVLFKELSEWDQNRITQLCRECGGEPDGTWVFDARGAAKAWELIGRDMGMFIGRVEHSGGAALRLDFGGDFGDTGV